MRSGFDRVSAPLAWVATLVCSACCGDAQAADRGDSTHGRIEGDVSFVAAVGGVAAARGPRLEGEVRVRYLETAGVFASYEDAPVLGSGAEPSRVVAGGLEVRPLFIVRWLKGMEASGARMDLLLDSLGLELGAVVVQPSGAAFGSRPGVQAGVGVELPILEGATGPWIGLHGGLRWSDGALGGSPVRTSDDRSLYLAVTLAWHEVVLAHIVDAGDPRPY